MAQYQIVYDKRGFPLASWEPDKKAAEQKAMLLRRSGYDVTVWEHDKNGAKLTKL